MYPDNNAPDFQLPSANPQQSIPVNGSIGQPEFAVPAAPVQPSGDSGQSFGVADKNQTNDVALVKQTMAQLKETLQKTANDPYNQVKAVENLKAVYLQTRFGRSIKVADE